MVHLALQFKITQMLWPRAAVPRPLFRQVGALCHQPELMMGSPPPPPCRMHRSPGCTSSCIASQGKGFLQCTGQPVVSEARLASLLRGDATSPPSTTARILKCIHTGDKNIPSPDHPASETSHTRTTFTQCSAILMLLLRRRPLSLSPVATTPPSSQSILFTHIGPASGSSNHPGH